MMVSTEAGYSVNYDLRSLVVVFLEFGKQRCRESPSMDQSNLCS